MVFLDEILSKDGVLEALDYINSKGFSEVISTKENVKLNSNEIAKLIDMGIIEVFIRDKTVMFTLSEEGRRILRLSKNI